MSHFENVLGLIFVVAMAGPTFADCGPATPGAAVTRKADWGRVFENLTEAREAYEDLYQSSRRLGRRAHRPDLESNFRLPVSEVRAVDLPPVFREAVLSHVRQALDQGYADFVFYPDFGHAHLLVPSDFKGDPWDHLDSPEILFLYHTAELIRLRHGAVLDGELVADPWLRWRYFTRNMIGRNDSRAGLSIRFEREARYNTVRSIPGFRQFGFLSLSANKNGCFEVQRQNSRNQESLRLDLSAASD